MNTKEEDIPGQLKHKNSKLMKKDSKMSMKGDSCSSENPKNKKASHKRKLSVESSPNNT